jgi:hypothetical protein
LVVRLCGTVQTLNLRNRFNERKSADRFRLSLSGITPSRLSALKR